VNDTAATKPAWRRLGAAFTHARGAGLTIILSLLPLGFDGRIVLVEPSTRPHTVARHTPLAAHRR
jgi:hypothetical protein